jgi:iron(II)-dependent oxidoreductase
LARRSPQERSDEAGGGRTALAVCLCAVVLAAPQLSTPADLVGDVVINAKTIAGLAPPAHSVTIPAGWFVMGSDRPHTGIARAQDPSERPQRKIWLDAYQIDRHEVSLGNYLGYILAKPRAVPPDLALAEEMKELADFAGIIAGREAPAPKLLALWPAFNVSWTDAAAYCRAKGGRLPTEAEWEKAARGTKGWLYPWGKAQPTPRRAVFGRIYGSALPQVEVIDSFAGGRSPYGLYHVAGNVAEWVNDWADTDAYRKMPERNPKGPAQGELKIIRGGSWKTQREFLRPSSRQAAEPTLRDPSIGFRCARTTR